MLEGFVQLVKYFFREKACEVFKAKLLQLEIVDVGVLGTTC
jgi:hypothetical protein